MWQWYERPTASKVRREAIGAGGQTHFEPSPDLMRKPRIEKLDDEEGVSPPHPVPLFSYETVAAADQINAPPPVTSDGKFNEDFASHFGLSRSQREQVRALIEDASVEIKNLQAEHCKAAKDDEGRWQLLIQAFPELGGRVRDQLFSSMVDVLGNELGAVVNYTLSPPMQLHGIYKMGGGEGLGRYGQQSITIRYTRDNDGILFVEDIWGDPETGGGGKRRINDEAEVIPKEWRYLLGEGK